MPQALNEQAAGVKRGPHHDPTRSEQEAEYVFPYHFIPAVNGDDFSATRYWSWGVHYLGGMHLVQSVLETLDFESLVDIGCGDGRFLADLRQAYPDAKLTGFDYSARSIGFARAFTPSVDFRVIDIIASPSAEPFDVATLLEVLEHIPPAEAHDFLAAVRRYVKPGGVIILTVPHINSPLIDKHYRHFTSRSLREALEPHFTVDTVGFFDRAGSLGLRCLKAAVGGGGRQFVITNSWLNRLLWKTYLRHHLHAADERDCRRLYAVVRRPS
jgi:SAM-dependent methyltransferase